MSSTTNTGRVNLPNCVRLDLYRHPDVPGSAVHDACGRTMHDHGWIDPAQSFHVQHRDGLIVCPRDGVDYAAAVAR